MVQYTDALNKTKELGLSSSAKTSVATYMATSSTTPDRARIRLAFFMITTSRIQLYGSGNYYKGKPVKIQCETVHRL